MDQDEKELLNFASLWDKAMVGNNAIEIGRFMSDDWTIIGADGITSKSKFLQLVADGTLNHSRMDSDEINIRMYGNTGIIVARGTSEGTFNGEKFSLYEWSTSVFIKKEGKWLCVVTMLGPAKKS